MNVFKTVSLTIGLLFSLPAYAVETVFWVDSQNGTAIGGYDPLSYFLSGQGRLGDQNYEYFWAGAVWRFENEGNLSAFRDAPLIYIPQFGGYDSVEMSHNKKVTPSPEFSDLYNNRLYLFHSQESLDIWTNAKDKYLKAAKRNWLSFNVKGISKNFIVQQLKDEEIFNIIPADTDIAKNPSKPLTKAELEKAQAIEEALARKKKRDEEKPTTTTTTEATPRRLTGVERLGAAGQHFKDK